MGDWVQQVFEAFGVLSPAESVGFGRPMEAFTEGQGLKLLDSMTSGIPSPVTLSWQGST